MSLPNRKEVKPIPIESEPVNAGILYGTVEPPVYVSLTVDEAYPPDADYATGGYLEFGDPDIIVNSGSNGTVANAATTVTTTTVDIDTIREEIMQAIRDAIRQESEHIPYVTLDEGISRRGDAWLAEPSAATEQYRRWANDFLLRTGWDDLCFQYDSAPRREPEDELDGDAPELDEFLEEFRTV